MKIKSELCKDYKHIYMLNGLSLFQGKNDSLYKYMPYNRLIDCVNNKELVFVSPETWIDPFERRFWQTDYSKRYQGFKRPEIACMCLTTKSSTNEEAAWKMYADNTDKALRISVRKKQLFDNLENMRFLMVVRFILGAQFMTMRERKSQDYIIKLMSFSQKMINLR